MLLPMRLQRVSPDPGALAWMAAASESDKAAFVAAMSKQERNAWRWIWRVWARDNQLPPAGTWRTWLILAGRGFGKTRAGAEWVREVAERDPAARIALVAANLGEARAIMVEGESGLRRIGTPAQRPTFESSLRRLTWPNGAQAMLYSAAEPESLRGPQHSHAWCDEIAKWEHSGDRAVAAWDNLLMGLRLGEDPRVVATTTPRDVTLVRRLLAEEGNGDTDDQNIVVTRGSTFDNETNLPARYVRAMRSTFGQRLVSPRKKHSSTRPFPGLMD
jgi:phage terminase large subunit-like protein